MLSFVVTSAAVLILATEAVSAADLRETVSASSTATATPAAIDQLQGLPECYLPAVMGWNGIVTVFGCVFDCAKVDEAVTNAGFVPPPVVFFHMRYGIVRNCKVSTADSVAAMVAVLSQNTAASASAALQGSASLSLSKYAAFDLLTALASSAIHTLYFESALSLGLPLWNSFSTTVAGLTSFAQALSAPLSASASASTSIGTSASAAALLASPSMALLPRQFLCDQGPCIIENFACHGQMSPSDSLTPTGLNTLVSALSSFSCVSIRDGATAVVIRNGDAISGGSIEESGVTVHHGIHSSAVSADITIENVNLQDQLLTGIFVENAKRLSAAEISMKGISNVIDHKSTSEDVVEASSMKIKDVLETTLKAVTVTDTGKSAHSTSSQKKDDGIHLIYEAAIRAIHSSSAAPFVFMEGVSVTGSTGSGIHVDAFTKMTMQFSQGNTLSDNGSSLSETLPSADVELNGDQDKIGVEFLSSGDSGGTSPTSTTRFAVEGDLVYNTCSGYFCGLLEDPQINNDYPSDNQDGYHRDGNYGGYTGYGVGYGGRG